MRNPVGALGLERHWAMPALRAQVDPIWAAEYNP
jgi:hypothetical protein